MSKRNRLDAPPYGYEELFIVVAAFRYAIGRKSYAPGLVADWIEARKTLLARETRECIAREIREELERAPKLYKEPLPYADRWQALAQSLEVTNEAEVAP